MSGIKASNDRATLRLLQETELQMASLFDGICMEHGLKYSLAYGSLLGAVRHQGFVPWDDDMDFVMPRDDYERFVALAPDALPSGYSIRSHKLGTCGKYVTRIVDEKTLVRLGSYQSDNEMPIWIDVFPLDGVPQNGIGKQLHYLHVFLLRGLSVVGSFESTVNLNRPGRPLWQKALIKFLSTIHIGNRIDAKRWLEKLDATLRKYPVGQSNEVFMGASTYGFKRETWPKAAFGRLRRLPFEDVGFLGPQNPEQVLGITYGDYMTPPPPEKRTIHHVEIVKHPEAVL